ncbi:hypothetical protein Tco_1453431 [Tanacetum coccineum]
MTKTTNKQGFISAVYEGKTHKDLHTCLFACFLSQEDPKRIAKALSDSDWVEEMQEELLQFKLQKVWVLVDLPKGNKAILSLCFLNGIYIVSMDVKSAFLYDRTKEEFASSSKSLVYVDDIIFGTTKKELCTEFKKLMHDKF